MADRPDDDAPSIADVHEGASSYRDQSEPMTDLPEILAPAGSPDALDAALRAGADAVYLGLDEGFNARARAENFSLDNLGDVAAKVHAAGARVYVTLNTLVFEPELDRVERIIRGVAEAGADAIIVQDPAVAMIAREVAPTLHVHASTQMTVSTGEAARFAQELGVRRVVVPRELSVDEIRHFAAATPLQLEVFIHGALCVSWSGQCLTSEAWSGRSANRGQCAQSCRLPYSLIVDGRERELGDVRYLLSPKDLAGARAVADLVATGVAGLKIEGRQKGPQYVSTAVAGYRRLVDGHDADDARRDAAERRFAADLLDMTLSYSRGFSDGFLGGSDHQVLVEGRFPKHRGVYVGRVASVDGLDVTVIDDPDGRPWTGAIGKAGATTSGPVGELEASLSSFGAAREAGVGPRASDLSLRAGLGVVFDAGHSEDKHEPGGVLFDAIRRRRGWTLRFGRPGPDLSRVTPGQRVWVTSDPRLRSGAEGVERRAGPAGAIAVAMTVDGEAGRPLVARARDEDGHEVEVVSRSPLAEARGVGLGVDVLRDKLGALGGSAYRLTELDPSSLAAGLHLPVSELKTMRRQVVAALDKARASTRTTDKPLAVAALRAGLLEALPPSRHPLDEPVIVPLCRSDAQLEAAIAAGCEEVELDWMELKGLRRAVARAREASCRATVATLRVQKPDEDEYFTAVRALSPDAILVRHLAGLMALADDPDRPVLHGDFSLNGANSLSVLHLLRHGLDTVTASFDLDEAQLDGLLGQVPAERIAVVVHHRVPAFHTEHCVYAHLLSNGRDYRTCGRPCEEHEVSLRDDAGRVHPVIVDAGCRNTVFNGEVQSAARVARSLVERGVKRFRVELVREDANETTRVIEAWRELLAGRRRPSEVVRTLGAKARLGVSDKAMHLLESRRSAGSESAE